ncbi:hypothetical protein [Rhizobium leguminosarum]|uniref:Uncharacterized protein n=1 Tax=Rhizobium leguminosarum TaxID=384 RepID=A0A1B1CKG7_RHILE|nr:hypothetical protein [Rhizobium leguminosarum]ANP90248.1 hypothetical protein BA011_40790 [Rhizobium leguminosarum]
MLERAAILTRDTEPIDTFYLFDNPTGMHRHLSADACGALVEHNISRTRPVTDAAGIEGRPPEVSF